jgi:branched-chain amino acid transport system ATP-binding protein
MTAAPVLVTTALCRSFGGLAAVRDVSLALTRGELHALIGPNGAGKSTLVNLLAGALAPTSGHIHLDGADITGERAWQVARRGVGRSYQRTNIFTSLDVTENVRLAAQTRLLDWRTIVRRASATDAALASAQRCLDRVGLADRASRQAGALSHGEQRLLEIAMVLATEPKVLLLDEPLAGMGAEESGPIARLLRELAREHAVLLVEHDMDFVFEVADRMTVMVDGAVLAEGHPESIRANADVQRAYLGGHV